MSWAEPDVWTASDGARLPLRRERARGASRGSLIFVHGWGDYTGRWSEQAAWFAERGLAVFGCDQRGHGGSPGRRGHVDRFAQFLSDLSALRKLAAAEAPGPQLLMGHSFGGLVVLRYLQSSPSGVTGAILLAPYVDLIVQPPKWKLALARLLVDLFPRLPIATGLDYDHISHDPDIVKQWRADPNCHERMTPRAYTEAVTHVGLLQAERERIRVPLYFALAGDDRIVSTAATEDLARRIGGDVTVRQYPGAYHNLLHDTDRARVYADLAPWLDRMLAGRVAA